MQEAELGKRLAERARLRPRQERGCPESELLAALATGEVQAGEREALLAHLEACPDCVTELAAAAAATELIAETQPRAVAPRLKARRFSSRRGWLRLAAALILVAGGLVTYRVLEAPPAELRGESPVWTVVPAHESELGRAPRELRWEALSDALQYDVELFDAAFSSLARSGALSEPRFVLPVELRLLPGATYFWRVEAKGARRDEASPVFSFRLRP